MRLSSLAWRNLATRKSRTFLTVAGVALGVAVILAVSVANKSTVAAFETMIDSMTGKADLLINGVSTGGFPRERLADVRRTSGVRTAAPGISRFTNLSIKGKLEELQFAGIDPLVDRRLRQYSLSEGRFLEGDEPEAVIPADLAAEKNIKTGDRVYIMESGRRHPFKIVGLLKNEGAGRFMGGRVVFIPLDEAARVFRLEGRLNFIDVQVREGRSARRVGDDVIKKLGPGYTVEQPEKRTEAVSQMLGGLRVGLAFFGAVAMFVGGFLVYNTFAMVVLEQTRELGVVRALGGSRAQIVRLVMSQAAFVGIVGSILGLAAGVGFAKILLGFVSDTVGMPIREITVPLFGVLTASGVGLLVTLTAALQPAITAGYISPLAAIRIWARPVNRRPRVLRAALALAALGAGIYVSTLPGGKALGVPASWAVSIHAGGNFAVLLGAALLSPSIIGPLGSLLYAPARLVFGDMGKLATANLRRNKGRTAATASAVMITLAMLISVGGMTSSFRLSVERWVDRSLGADVYVSGPSTDVSFDPSYAGKLRRVPGVGDMTLVGYAPVKLDASTVIWRGIEPDSYRRFASMQVVKGRPEAAWDELDKTRRVFISTVMADKRDLEVGDKLTLPTTKGNRKFTVAGVVVDFGGDMGELVVGTRRDLKEYFGVTDISAFRIKVERGAEPAEVADRIERRFRNTNFEVNDVQEFKDMVDEQVNKSFAVFSVLIALAAVVAMISVFNTFMMNILERRREIGVIRAVGATRGQVRLVNLIEAFLTGTAGAVLGLAVGWFMASDIVKNMKSLTGYEVDFIFPLEMTAAAFAAAVLFSVAAALYPAYRAARVEIAEAVGYE